MKNDCAIESLNFIFSFFYRSYTEKLKKANLNEILGLLSKSELEFHIFLPIITIFSPFYWIILLKFKNRVSFCEFTSDAFPENSVLLIHATASQVYNIKEFWTHYLCYYKKNELIYCHDPYLESLKIDYPNHFDYSPLSVWHYSKITCIQILIHEKQFKKSSI